MSSNITPPTEAPKLKESGQHSKYEISFYAAVVFLNISYMLYQVYKSGEGKL